MVAYCANGFANQLVYQVASAMVLSHKLTTTHIGDKMDTGDYIAFGAMVFITLVWINLDMMGLLS